MGRILIDDITANHDAWIAQKGDTIGSGDIGVICGLSPYQTPLGLWAVKTRREAPSPDNVYMAHGRAMEPVIAALYARELDLELEYGNRLYAHDDEDWAVATPDYFARTAEDETDRILECKNVGHRSTRHWDDETPLWVELQVHWQMGIVGTPRAIVAPLLGGDPGNLAPRYMEYNPHLFEQIMELCTRFRWHIQKDVPPPPEGQDVKLVQRIVGELRAETVVLPDELLPVAQAYAALSDQMTLLNSQRKELEEERDKLKARLLLALGGAAQGSVGAYQLKSTQVTVKERLAPAYSYQRFALKEFVK